MKRIIALAIAVAVFAGFQAPVFSAESNANAPVYATVTSLFNLSLTPASVVLGSVAQGARTTEVPVAFHIATNHNLGWNVQLDATPLVHTDTITTMPLKYRFTWDGFPGTMNPVPPAEAFIAAWDAPVEQKTIFTKSTTENWADFVFEIYVYSDVPALQKSGDYTATMFAKLVDTF